MCVAQNSKIIGATMGKILYFNINYKCNNNCIFCFSHNVGTTRKDMSIDNIKKTIENTTITPNDLIVINGGEPCVYPDFDNLLEYISRLNCQCNIYTNGTLLMHSKIPISNSNILFVIPVHGSQITHNFIAGRTDSYTETIQSLIFLQKHNIRYALKFIISKEMIFENFNISQFIKEYSFNPEVIYLARMNTTIKSTANKYTAPNNIEVVEFLNYNASILKSKYLLKYLDFAPCMISEIHFIHSKPTELETHKFYFNDSEYTMQNRNYYKERLTFDRCTNCMYNNICDYLSDSYYILSQYCTNELHLKLE